MSVAVDPAPEVRVLVVDEDPSVRHLVTATLRREGFVTDELADGLEALERLRSGPPDLLVLDLRLPGVDGLEVLKSARETWNGPVVMLSARDDEIDRIVGLELGADDYVVKPFSPRELAVRARNILRRVNEASSRRRVNEASSRHRLLEFGDLVIDPGTREVRVAGVPVGLTAKEFDLLVHLARSPRRVFTRDQLLVSVWNSSPEWQTTATVTEHVRRLRRAIEKDPSNPRWIRTVRGVGYRLEV